MSIETIGRLTILLGIVLVIAGGIILLVARLGIPLGKLPGDLQIQGENFTCVFPIVTMIIVSILLTVVLNIIIRLINR